jgi:hypothetical protein
VTAGVIWLRSGEELVVKNPDTTPVAAQANGSNAVVVPDGNIETPGKSAEPIEQRATQASVRNRPATKRSYPQPVKAPRERPMEVKQTTARNEPKAVPRLNEYPDDEDTSLRLAELLEDIGSR